MSNFSNDAGGRARVSQFTTLGDYKTLGIDRVLRLDTAGTGTATFESNQIKMDVTAGQYLIRYARQPAPYFSGKSEFIEETVRNFHPQEGVIKRMGYFSSNATAPYNSSLDGFWIESLLTNGEGQLRLKSARTGTATLDELVDRISGGSPIYWDGFTVVAFDFLWLGGAVLRSWLKDRGDGFALLKEHTYVGDDNVFMSTPQHPLRFEIRSTTGSGTMSAICAQVSTEGSTDEAGEARAIKSPTGGIACASVNTTYPLIAIRKNSLYRDTALQIVDLEAFVTSANDQIEWSLQINPTLSAPLTYSDMPYSAAQKAYGNGTITVITDGIDITAGTTAQNLVPPSKSLEKNYLAWLGGKIDNTMDEVVLCGKPITSGVTIYPTLRYKEY